MNTKWISLPGLIAISILSSPLARAESGSCIVTALQDLNLKDRVEGAVVKLRQIRQKNMARNGSVIAADGGNPDYAATWIRDASIVRLGDLQDELNAFTEKDVDEALKHLSPEKAEQLFQKHKPFVDYLTNFQEAVNEFDWQGPGPYPGDPLANHRVGLGEPRATSAGHRGETAPGTGGEMITEPFRPGPPQVGVNRSPRVIKWGRPQNDGPGRALSFLSLFSRIAIKAGHPDFVKSRILNATKSHDFYEAGIGNNFARYIMDAGPNGGRSHAQPTFDAWEVKKVKEGGGFFDTALAQAVGLQEFAKVADALGNTRLAAKYRRNAQEIASKLDLHWDPKEKSLVAAVGRDEIFQAHDSSNVDALTLSALVHSRSSHLFMRLDDDRALATIEATENKMRQIMPRESQMLSGAIPIGRSNTDDWIGIHGQYAKPGTYPWFIETADFSTLYSSIAEDTALHGTIQITPTNHDFFLTLLKKSPLDPRFMPGATLRKGTLEFSQTIEALRHRADDYMRMVTDAVQHDGTTGEGFNPVTREPLGPRNLTWNTVEYARAVAAWKKMHEVLDSQR